MIRRLNQQIKAWTMYHRYAASKRTSTYVDHRIFQMVWRWCRRRHQNKRRKVDQGEILPADGHRHGSSPARCATRRAKAGRFS